MDSKSPYYSKPGGRRNYQKPEDLIGENGLLKQLTKLLVEKALDAEMTEHLGHEKHEPVVNGAGNTRNGRSRKTLKGEFGELPIEVPRDRHGSFEPKLIPNGWDGNTIVQLSNGQIWQQREYYYHYRYAYRPSVTITNDGGYRMLVEGVPRAVRVERIK